jgi:hypothetical protein
MEKVNNKKLPERMETNGKRKRGVEMKGKK